MRTTIDKAGRVVIPAPIRTKAGLRPGTEIEISLVDDGVHLTPAVPRARLVCRNGRLVAVATAPAQDLPQVDVAALVSEERERWPL